MKKIQYITPAIKIVKVESQSILAGSTTMGVNGSKVDEALSRRGLFNYYDDEDED